MTRLIKPGKPVYHTGTKRNATVLRAQPQRDGTVEYLVQPDGPLFDEVNVPVNWSSAHVAAGTWRWPTTAPDAG